MSDEDKTNLKSTETGGPSDAKRRMSVLEAVLARGEEDIKKGRTLTQKQARERMARWFKVD